MSIAVSLSLGGILLLVVSSMVLTRSPEQAARLFFPDGDYKIYLSSEQPEEEVMVAGNPLDEELKQEILSVDGVRSVLVTRRSLHAKFGTPESAEAGMCDYQFPFLQMGLFLLVLLGMEAILSVWMVRRQKKQSLVEQMRAQS